jgi:hypothetical protein
LLPAIGRTTSFFLQWKVFSVKLNRKTDLFLMKQAIVFMCTRITFLFLLLLILQHSPAQSVVIDAAQPKPVIDSIQKAGAELVAQLGRAGYPGIEIRQSLSARDKDIFISIKSGAAKKSTQLKQLRQSGTEGFWLFSDGKKVNIIGNSALAVQHGIFMYLEKLGFRYYFPHPAWHIIPQKPLLFRSMNVVSQPSFVHRRIWYGYGTGSLTADSNYKFWFRANRQGGAMQMVVGHAYDDIVIRNKEVFQQHPEWFYPVPAKGVLPNDPKFDIANESLVKFIISDVLKRLEQAKAKNLPLKMITLAPSDGLGTCSSPACLRLGTITDRVYSLINRVAKEVRKQYPDTWISGMAYSEYSAPPSAKLEPNTFVSIATAFNYTAYSTDELISEWGKKAGKVGVYDYLGLYVWDFDLPGKGQGSQVDKTIAAIKKYYRLGARGYDTETTPGSINKGLGHYLVSQLVWDINADIAGLKKEFFVKCFGKAAPLMSALWNEWEIYPYTAVRETDLAAWIDTVNEAAALESNPAFATRIFHIKTYLHYLYLYNNFKNNKEEASTIDLLTYCYNTMDIGSVSGYPALFEIGNLSPVPGVTTNDPKARYKKINPLFTQPAYTDRLVSADRKTLQSKQKIRPIPPGNKWKQGISSVPAIFNDKAYVGYKGTTAFTGPHHFVIKINEPGEKNYINLAGGFVTGGGSSRAIIVSVSGYTGTLQNDPKIISQFKYTASRDTQLFSLKNLPKGYYLLKVDDPAKIFRISFSPSISNSLIVTPQNPFNGYSRYLCFYVPGGTKVFRAFKEIEVILVSPTGRVIDKTAKKSEEFDVTVMPGEEGLWMINFLNGRFHLEGIPPYLSTDPSKMLISD